MENYTEYIKKLEKEKRILNKEFDKISKKINNAKQEMAVTIIDKVKSFKIIAKKIDFEYSSYNCFNIPKQINGLKSDYIKKHDGLVIFFDEYPNIEVYTYYINDEKPYYDCELFSFIDNKTKLRFTDIKNTPENIEIIYNYFMSKDLDFYLNSGKMGLL